MINKVDMKDRVRQLIKNACPLDESCICETVLMQSLSLNSLTFVSLIIAIEEEFEILFEDEELNICDYLTVGDLLSIINEKCKAGNKTI